MKRVTITSVLFLIVSLSAQLHATPPTGTQADNNWWGFYDISWFDQSNIQDEYTFTTAAQLAGLSYLINGNGNSGSSGTESPLRNKIFKLGADIDLSDHYWVPIGQGQNSFGGWFDGQGHTISGLYIDYSDAQYAYVGVAANIHQGAANVNTGNMAGLFGRVNNQGADSYIKNIILDKGLVKTHPSNYSVGALIGFNNRNANLSVFNVINRGVEVIGGAHVGGLIGFSNAGVIYYNLANWASVTMDYTSDVLPEAAVYGGGIIGGSQNVTSLNNSYNSGTVTKTSGSTNIFIGGLVGAIGTTTTPISNATSDNLTGDNNYYLDNNTYKDSGNSAGNDIFIGSAKSLNDMKTNEFVAALNINNIGEQWVKKPNVDFPVFENTTTTGIKPLKAPSFTAYASHGIIFVSRIETGIVEVYNLTGQKVWSNIAQEELQIVLPKGIYIIKAAGATQKIIN
ncbi:MAG: T9SS type A sorting domain-containing protein [Dysgonamonadaceae bacterium]|jgi:hypothetical protein|nr:T9SS type A sorting domain-containing protein [Dysgonamonadaceae bacterium]